MENKQYDYVENPFNVTRRQFMTIGGLIVALMVLPSLWVRSLVSNRSRYILARTKGLYRTMRRLKSGSVMPIALWPDITGISEETPGRIIGSVAPYEIHQPDPWSCGIEDKSCAAKK